MLMAGLCLLVIHCPALDTTYADLNSTDTEFGVTVNISCLPGYRINGQTTAVVHCTGTGQWSLDNDTCLRMPNLIRFSYNFMFMFITSPLEMGLSTSHIPKTTRPKCTQFSCMLPVMWLWWRSDILCTSGIVDEVTFSRKALWRVMFIPQRRQNMTCITTQQ